MSRYGKNEAYQFAIATGLDFTKEVRAPLLKAPPGDGWELIFVQFVTDWYTVWRRPRDSPGARKENRELSESGYTPPVAPIASAPVYEDLVGPANQVYDKGFYGPGAVQNMCPECGFPIVGTPPDALRCSSCNRGFVAADLMGSEKVPPG